MKRNISLLLIITLLLSFSSNTFAASVGTQLTSPESGWKRYDDTNSAFRYVGTWAVPSNPGYFNGAENESKTLNSKVSFNFTGSKLRIIGAITSLCSSNVSIKVDGVEKFYNNYTATPNTTFQILLFEQTGLTDVKHTVEITPTEAKYITFDAVDIDSNGYLENPTDPLIPLVQGWNSITARVNISNYGSTRAIQQSLILPYGYANAIK